MSNIPITRLNLHAPDTLVALGALVAKQLDAEGVCILRFSPLGVLELADPLEPLDALPEAKVIQHMLAQGASEEQITRYLRNRDERLKAQGGTDGPSV
jgi:hypothetical protein